MRSITIVMIGVFMLATQAVTLRLVLAQQPQGPCAHEEQVGINHAAGNVRLDIIIRKQNDIITDLRAQLDKLTKKAEPKKDEPKKKDENAK